MAWLLFVSLAWAFSFGMIKGNLTGVDSNFVSFARMALALIVFLPFVKFKKVGFKLGWKLAVAGMVEFGIMYIAYIAAFRYLQAYEVALFTIFTPLYVALIDSIMQKKFNFIYLAAAILAVFGTWIIEQGKVMSPSIWLGFLLVQVSNLAFAFGQTYYRKVMASAGDLKDRDVFGVLYLGAVIVTALATLIFVPLSSISLTTKQVWTLAYLGIFASGFCFFVWNLGARKVNTGALAIFNDLKVPLAVAVSLIFFGEKTNLTNLLLGGVVIVLSLVLNEDLSKKKLERAKSKQSDL
jgi:drug/metabolite transporter (DMT)-like permease